MHLNLPVQQQSFKRYKAKTESLTEMMLNISKYLDINNYKYTTKLVELKGSFRKKSTDQSKCFKKTAQNF